MANKMLIDASHPEETRVVVLRGNRVEDFDFESASKKQLRGNIYLAKVTRVEPSLQAAFVDYGGNRHGFLAFSEIHPDYYQIPIVDRQALIEEEAQAHRDEENDEPRGNRRSRRHKRGEPRAERRNRDADEVVRGSEEPHLATPEEFSPSPERDADNEPSFPREAGASDQAHLNTMDAADAVGSDEEAPREAAGDPPVSDATPAPHLAETSQEAAEARPEGEAESLASPADREDADDAGDEEEEEPVEQLGGDVMEEMPSRSHKPRRQYKIQEVIKRRQILLVQVVKEERGNKGAALTTYLSLAGRYSVLMPNTARGGGISRKITDADDRQRLKAIAQELEVPEGMGVILRTAGAARTKAEVKRDFEYLLRLWETVRETTLRSTAPTLVYEEGSLIKRAIRDLYHKEIDEIVVAGDAGFQEARDFMRLLMPSHVKSVQFYRDPQPLFAKTGADAQLDAMFSNHVTLKSGGYLVINQTEALVAIDVNSGRSTREHDIEDTAHRTNLEAADEVARQLRLRDLAGLIVVDFIDMEEGRNNRAVERRLKDALKNDRARIQVGRISHFGLLEMSRQRMRTGVLEGSTVACPHCAGAGTVRSTASIALHVLRVLEDALIKSASHNITVKTRTSVALYILNQKRSHLFDLESRFGVGVTVSADDTLIGTTYHALERGDPALGPQTAIPTRSETTRLGAPEHFLPEAEDTGSDEEENLEVEAGGDEAIGDEKDGAENERRRRRRRRRRRGERDPSDIAPNAPQPSDEALGILAQIDDLRPAVETAEGGEDEVSEEQPGEGETRNRRRRSRRGGRGPRQGRGPDFVTESAEHAALSDGEPNAQAPEDGIGEEAVAAKAETRHIAESPASLMPESTSDAVTDLPVSEQPAASALQVSEGPIAVATPAAPSEPAPIPVTAPLPVSAPQAGAVSQPAEAEDDPTPNDLPKRSGWWQRAKATLGG